MAHAAVAQALAGDAYHAHCNSVRTRRLTLQRVYLASAFVPYLEHLTRHAVSNFLDDFVLVKDREVLYLMHEALP